MSTFHFYSGNGSEVSCKTFIPNVNFPPSSSDQRCLVDLNVQRHIVSACSPWEILILLLYTFFFFFFLSCVKPTFTVLACESRLAHIGSTFFPKQNQEIDPFLPVYVDVCCDRHANL